MPKKVEIGGKQYVVPDTYDSTKHEVRIKDNKLQIVNRNGGGVVSTHDVKPASDTQTNSGQNSQASGGTDNTPAPEQQKKLTEKDKLVGSGIYMNVQFSNVDESIHDVIITNAGKFQISVFLVPKFTTGQKIFTKQQAIFLKYGDTVKSIVLQDDIDNIGLTGYIQVDNRGSFLDAFLGRHNVYYVVINITKYKDNELGVQQIQYKYEPYIFDIDSVTNVSSSQKQEKILKIGLVDIVTSILKTHSIASVIKFHKDIVQCGSYKYIFEKILEYVKNYIKVNTNNKYQFKKDLLYGENTICFGRGYNGYDAAAGMQQLIKSSFSKIPRNASIMQALDVLLVDCCTSMKTPKSFSDNYMTIGDVLIPFFFKQQYPDPCGVYSQVWTTGIKDNTTSGTGTASSASGGQTSPATQPSSTTNTTSTTQQPSAAAPSTTTPTETTTNGGSGDATPTTRDIQPRTPTNDGQTGNNKPTDSNPTNGTTTPTTNTNQQNSDSSGGFIAAVDQFFSQLPKNDKKKNNMIEFVTTSTKNTTPILMRQMTMRDIYMPFFLAFADDKYSGVFQGINPQGESIDENDIMLLGHYHGQIKSMQFNPIDMNSVAKLWKNVVFLDCSDKATCLNSTLIFFSWFFDFFQHVFLNSQKRGLVSNVMPDFFMLSRTEGIKHAQKQNETFENKFDEYNAYTYATETQDSVKQCLRLMGKNLASFTLVNDSYTFTINGNLLRRPNQIIKMWYKGNKKGAYNQMLTYATNLLFGDYVYLYVRKVTHKFIGSYYDNDIVGCKICEQLNLMKMLSGKNNKKKATQ